MTARFTPDGAHLFVLSDAGGGQGFEPLARDPLGGRSRALAATRVHARRRRPHSRAVGGARPRAGLPVGLPLGLTARDRPSSRSAPGPRMDRAYTALPQPSCWRTGTEPRPIVRHVPGRDGGSPARRRAAPAFARCGCPPGYQLRASAGCVVAAAMGLDTSWSSSDRGGTHIPAVEHLALRLDIQAIASMKCTLGGRNPPVAEPVIRPETFRQCARSCDLPRAAA